MNLNDLIKSTEEKLTNPDLTIGTRRREEAILHHLTNLERTVTELVSENTEMYVDLCEMGELARAGYTMNRHHLPKDEPKTERVHLFMDDTETQQFFLGDNMFYELKIDKLIRHKWPEEEPEPRDAALIRKAYNGVFEIAWYDGENWWSRNCTFPIDGVTEWWNLPEVGNE